MRQRMKKIVGRYMLAAFLFACIVTAGFLFYRQPDPGGNIAVPPSKVIVAQAVVVEQGVQLQWLQSQPGTHAVAGYVIERSRGGSGFERIARAEPVFLDYLDADGKKDDSYRVIAEDSSGGHSPASEQMVATPAVHGSDVAVAPVVPNVLGASTALAQAKTPGQKAEELQALLAKLFSDFDAALRANDHTTARSLLFFLQYYQRQALSLWPQLAADKKAALAQTCAEHINVFEANLHLLPESDQFDGMLAAAGCDAIQEGAE